MTVAAGARLGPYEVVSPIGAGGMAASVAGARHAHRPRCCDQVSVAGVRTEHDPLRRLQQEDEGRALYLDERVLEADIWMMSSR